MSSQIVLEEVGLPPLAVAEDPPTIAAAEYERRMSELLARAGVDWVVVYGDPEHAGNLAYTCGFDPRFEEALLVLGRDVRRLIVGVEGVEYARISPVELESIEVPTFSVMGLDRSRGAALVDALGEVGVRRGDRVGVVGWKSLSRVEWRSATPAICAPAFVVDALREIAGGTERVVDVTDALLDAGSGLRMSSGADQIAYCEWGASRSSAATFNVIHGATVGMSERDLIANMDYRGEPLAHRAVAVTGSNASIILRSPTSRRVALGEAALVLIGYWGGGCGRGGMIAAGEQDLAPSVAGYLEEIAIPYWRTIVAWWETVHVGISGGEVHDRLSALCEAAGFEPPWGVGHCTDFEDWPNTPLRRGSSDRIPSGMVLVTDIYCALNGPATMTHCQDPVAVADEELRAELAERHPEVWSRIVARREHLREQLGVQVSDDLLPLTAAPAYLAPFWLKPELTLRVSA